MLPDAFTPAHQEVEYLSAGQITIALHGDTLITCNQALASVADLQALPAAQYVIHIGQLESQIVQMAVWDAATPLPETLATIDLRASFDVIGETLWALAGRASQIATFYRTHRFCGVCSAATQPLTHEAACECTACGHRVWPRVSPAVMVLIRRGDVNNQELLLARSPHFRAGMYSALAGFVEPGESLEQCAQREVLEEVGVRIKNLRWFGSQSWAFPHSLMLAMIADYESGEIVCQEGEIEDARWFNLAALPDLPSSYSVAWRLIDAAIRGDAV